MKNLFLMIRKEFTLLVIFGLLSSCIANNDVKITIKKPKENLTDTSISNIQVVNHQVVLIGTSLDKISNLKIKDGSLETVLQIESNNGSTLVANTISNVTFAADKILSFIISNANASATFTVNFSLCNSTLGTKAFDCAVVPNDKEVLSYDAASGKWKPRALNGLSYLGTFDASSGSAPTAQPAGSYYIISIAGTISTISFEVGDWIVSTGAAWQKISNSQAITTVFGRTGAVVATEGDYNLDKLSDVDLTTVAPILNDVLKYDGTKWVPGALSAGGITLSSLSATSPLLYTSGTGVFSIQAATTSQAGSLSSTDKTKLDSLEAFPSGNGLVERFSGTLLMKSCSAGQFLTWLSPTGWTCTTTLSMSGDSAQSVTMARNSNAGVAGTTLTVQAGGANSGSSNLAGGNLFLSSGTSTGTGTSSINFQTSSAGSSGAVDNTPTTKMTILGSGNVGIGTNSPSQLLNLQGNGATIRVDSAYSGYFPGLEFSDSGSVKSQFKWSGSNYDLVIGSVSNNAVRFTTNNSEKMRVDAGGNVGIGTNAPVAPLHVNSGYTGSSVGYALLTGTPGSPATTGSTQANGSLRIATNSTNSAVMDIGIYNTFPYGTWLQAQNGGDFSQHGAYPLVLQPNGGYVGIGTNAPGSLLDLSSNGGRIRITQNTSGSIFNGIDFYGYSGGNAGGINFNQSSGEIRYTTGINYFPTFYSSNSEAMRISTAGNVGIGTISPTTKLDVSGNLKVQQVSQGVNSTEKFYPNVVSSAQNATVTGAWIVHTPIPRNSNLMFKIRVHGYGYGAGSNIDFSVVGYSYAGGVGSVDAAAGAVISYSLIDHGNDGLAKAVGVNAAGNVAVSLGSNALSAYFYRLSVDAWITRTSTDYFTGWSIDQNTTAGFGWLDYHSLTTPISVSGNNLSIAGSTNFANQKGYANYYGALDQMEFGAVGATTNLSLVTNSVSRLNITNAGSVGIGTYSPGAPLEISSAADGILRLRQNEAGDVWSYIEFYNNTNRRFYAGTDAAGNFRINRDQAAGNLLLMDQGGNVGIGTTAPSYLLDVSGVARFTGGYTTSDIRYKKNVEILTGALDKILSLRGVTYYFKTEEFPKMKFQSSKQVGLIAQEVEKVIPEVVDTAKDGYKSVNYPALISPLIEGLKDFYHKWKTNSEAVNRNIASLEIKVKKLEDENIKLNKKVKEYDDVKKYLCQKDPKAAFCH